MFQGFSHICAILFSIRPIRSPSPAIPSSVQVADLASSIFGSFVAVTGDAHQAKVAQDIFRQQVRYLGCLGWALVEIWGSGMGLGWIFVWEVETEIFFYLIPAILLLLICAFGCFW